MNVMRVVLLAVIIFSFSDFSLAQEKPHEALAEKQRRLSVLVESTLADIPNLRLPENRAFISAKLGGLLCKADRKHSDALLRNAIGELSAMLQSSAESKDKNHQNQLLATRPQIFHLIGACDAELALDALYKTRPSTVTQVLASKSAKVTKISQYSNGQDPTALGEENLEQILLRLAADQNPDRAVKLLKESLKKPISHESLELIRKLHEKDPVSAREMTTEFIGRLTANGFMLGNQADHNSINIATNLLNTFIHSGGIEVKSPFDPAEMRSLADKVVAFFLNPKQVHNGSYYVGQTIRFAEKLVPGAVARLKEIQRETERRHGGNEHQEEINQLLASEATPQQLIAAARKFPLSSRGSIYENAASKLANSGDIAGARQLIEDNFSDYALENALNNLNSRQYHELQGKSKYAEAETLIETFPENSRFGLMINIATSAFANDREKNRGYALGLLSRARSSVDDRLETAEEIGKLVQLISAYSDIEPDEAFGILAVILPRVNEVTDASVVVNGFQGNSNIRLGEMMISQGISGAVYLDPSIFARLAEKDFDRTMAMIGNFSRRETRIWLRLQLAENGQFRNLSIVYPNFRRGGFSVQ